MFASTLSFSCSGIVSSSEAIEQGRKNIDLQPAKMNDAYITIIVI